MLDMYHNHELTLRISYILLNTFLSVYIKQIFIFYWYTTMYNTGSNTLSLTDNSDNCIIHYITVHLNHVCILFHCKINYVITARTITFDSVSREPVQTLLKNALIVQRTC